MRVEQIGDATLYLGDKRKRRGQDHPHYRGGKSHDANGYITFTSGPNAGKREHRVIAAQMLGRELLEHEIVHHKNGNKADNRPENLSIESRASHNREHGSGQEHICSECGESKWYSPSVGKRLSSPYRCRTCWATTGGNRRA